MTTNTGECVVALAAVATMVNEAVMTMMMTVCPPTCHKKDKKKNLKEHAAVVTKTAIAWTIRMKTMMKSEEEKADESS